MLNNKLTIKNFAQQLYISISISGYWLILTNLSYLIYLAACFIAHLRLCTTTKILLATITIMTTTLPLLSTYYYYLLYYHIIVVLSVVLVVYYAYLSMTVLSYFILFYYIWVFLNHILIHISYFLFIYVLYNRKIIVIIDNSTLVLGPVRLW